MDILFSLRLGRDSFTTVDFAYRHCMEVLQPSVAGLCQLNVEHASVDDLGYRDFAIVAFDDLGTMVQLLDQAANGVSA